MHDDVRGINFLQLVALWLDVTNKEEFSEYYPYAADYFQIRVAGGIEDPRTLQDFLVEFKGCYHIKVWCYGNEVAVTEYQH